MKLKFVYGFLPAIVFYTDKLIPKRFGAYTIGPIVLIRPKYKDNEGLLQHELTHVKQMYRTLLLHGLFYLLSKGYRLRAEVEAYRVQLQYPPASESPHKYRKKFAKFIATKYGLSISEKEAEELLR